MLEVVQEINSYLSDYVLVFLLLSVGLWYSVRTSFVQIRCFKEGFSKTFGGLAKFGQKQDSGMSSFQALATAIAAQVGTTPAAFSPGIFSMIQNIYLNLIQSFPSSLILTLLL